MAGSRCTSTTTASAYRLMNVNVSSLPSPASTVRATVRPVVTDSGWRSHDWYWNSMAAMPAPRHHRLAGPASRSAGPCHRTSRKADAIAADECSGRPLSLLPMYRTTIKEDKMSDFKLNCEHFLATTRQHFFASDSASSGQQGVSEDDSADHFCETAHGAHCG
jgi:hypothetical protein